MAASAITAFVVIFDDPPGSRNPNEKQRANLSDTFELAISSNIRTLSANTGGNDDIEGLLYVPDFPAGSPCINETKFPPNATRRSDLPNAESLFIALAPWTSQNCVLAMFAAASKPEGNFKGATGFITWLPDDSHAGLPPPPNNDPAWDLNDGGSWKKKNKYPVYAIPGAQGSLIMEQLGKYSGNISDAPNGNLLVDQYGDSNSAKMYATVQTSDNQSLPSLWAFLLIVLGIVLFLIGLTSGIMHLYQRRRRNALRRRIANGEVDLELLGIKRLTVPQEAINLLPLMTYVAEKETPDRPRNHLTALSDFPIKQSEAEIKTTTLSKSSTLLPDSTAIPPPSSLQPENPSSPTKSVALPSSPRPSLHPTSPRPTSPLTPTNIHPAHPYYTQPTCAICLDDFQPLVTTVRSLPCYHIYHPECIDTFLRENSSLCPVCKAKVLPKGYCPDNITNAMVRRERQQRRNRERIRRARGEEAAAAMPVAARTIGQGGGTERGGRLLAVQGRMASFHRQFGRARRAFQPPSNTGVEMTPAPNTTDSLPTLQPPTASTASPADPASAPSPSAAMSAHRSERARRRVSALLGHEPTVEDEERERWASLPRWRKAVMRVFPGFG